MALPLVAAAAAAAPGGCLPEPTGDSGSGSGRLDGGARGWEHGASKAGSGFLKQCPFFLCSLLLSGDVLVFLCGLFRLSLFGRKSLLSAKKVVDLFF